MGAVVMTADAAGTLWLGSGGRSERRWPREAIVGKLRTAAVATPRLHRKSRTAVAGRFAKMLAAMPTRGRPEVLYLLCYLYYSSRRK